MNKVCIVYHSGYGHTQKMANAVAEGAGSADGVQSRLIKAETLDEDSADWEELDSADAIILGSPTYMDKDSDLP